MDWSLFYIYRQINRNLPRRRVSLSGIKTTWSLSKQAQTWWWGHRQTTSPHPDEHWAWKVVKIFIWGAGQAEVKSCLDYGGKYKALYKDWLVDCSPKDYREPDGLKNRQLTVRLTKHFETNVSVTCLAFDNNFKFTCNAPKSIRQIRSRYSFFQAPKVGGSFVGQLVKDILWRGCCICCLSTLSSREPVLEWLLLLGFFYILVVQSPETVWMFYVNSKPSSLIRSYSCITNSQYILIV